MTAALRQRLAGAVALLAALTATFHTRAECDEPLAAAGGGLEAILSAAAEEVGLSSSSELRAVLATRLRASALNAPPALPSIDGDSIARVLDGLRERGETGKLERLRTRLGADPGTDPGTGPVQGLDDDDALWFALQLGSTRVLEAWLAGPPGATFAVDATALASAQPGSALELPLTDGMSVRGEVRRRNVNAFGRTTISGVLDNSGGNFVFAFNDGAIAGVVRSGTEGPFDIITVPGGGLGLLPAPVIRRVPPGFTCCGFQGNSPQPHTATGAPNDCDDGSVIDVLVVYTPQAREWAGGIGEIEATIDMMIEDGNASHANSHTGTSFNLVYARQIEISDLDITLSALSDTDDGILDTVHGLRDAYGADVVALVKSGGGGVSYGLASLNAVFATKAFCLNGIGSASGMVLAHEVGHLLGCCHAINDGGGCAMGLLFDWSNGHRFTGVSGTLWRTVMAYDPGVKIHHYSNPAILYDGVPTGAPPGNPAIAADNTGTMEVSAPFVANYRCNDGVCEALALPSTGGDCDGNDVPDACEIALGLAPDVDGDGVPDDCTPCAAADFDHDGEVSFPDLIVILTGWGDCPGPGTCIGDIDADGDRDFADLIKLLRAWGPCG